MEVKLSALLGNYDSSTSRPTDRRTDRVKGKFTSNTCFDQSMEVYFFTLLEIMTDHGMGIHKEVTLPMVSSRLSKKKLGKTYVLLSLITASAVII